VVGRDRDDGGLVAKALAEDTGDGARAEAERDLQLTGGNLLGERSRAVVLRAHADLRAAAGELGQHRLDHVVRAGRQAESQLPRLAAGVAASDLVGRAGRLDGSARGDEHRGAGLGQLDAGARAVEQRHAELALEPGDLLAQGRLGDVQALGGTTEVQLVGEHDERAQEPRIARHARSL
jgi:hypothetical protein